MGPVRDRKGGVRKKFLRVVAVASSRQLPGHVGPAGRRFWVSRAPRPLVPPGRGGAADGHVVSPQPLAGYCPQCTGELGQAQKFYGDSAARPCGPGSA